MNIIYKNKMKKILIIVIAILTPVISFSQARVMLNGNVYVNLNGGTAVGNGAYLVIDNSATNAISQVTGGQGFIISEKEFNMVKWDIGTTTGAYMIPYYDITDGYYIPFTLTIGTAGRSEEHTSELQS